MLIDEHRIVTAYIQALENASLDHENLPPDVLQRLRFPEKPPSVDDPDILLSLRLYLSSPNIAVGTYSAIREAILLRHPAHPILSFDQVKKKIAEITGVVSVVEDMCINLCMAYTGPLFSPLDKCHYCGEPRYDLAVLAESNGKTKRPRQVYHTMLLGPQLQAQRSTPEGAREMLYRLQETERILREMKENGHILKYKDALCGEQYLKAVERGEIGPYDPVLVLSIDDAQLYHDKKSDCWMYIWMLLDLRPGIRYLKLSVNPGGIIPGPNKPKNIESYMYTGLHHLCALQREGLPMWDGLQAAVIDTRPYLALETADTPGLSTMSGFVGHTGALGCRVNCGVRGRRRPGTSTYYPAHMKPVDDYTVPGCLHDSIDLSRPLPPLSPAQYAHDLNDVLRCTTQAEFEHLRKSTGTAKPTIFSGVKHAAPVPSGFPLDVMHALGLNIPELQYMLFRGTMECVAPDCKSTWKWAAFMKDDVWKEHGKTVAIARPYLPNSFDRPPRNPAEKINSGYKSAEYQTYMYGLGPGLFYRVLPNEYWSHFCKLVRVARLAYQHKISFEEVETVHKLSVEYVGEYEELYYQGLTSRIHFCQQSIHTLLHLAPETVRGGPLAYHSQYPMEHTIGNLGLEIKQPSNPYGNLSQRAVICCQVNALKVMIPDVTRTKPQPKNVIDVGNGYMVLHPHDRYARPITGNEGLVIASYLQGDDEDYSTMRLVRSARLRLPNGQIARSMWKERKQSLQHVRMARNVKLKLDGKLAFGEVQFYFPPIHRPGMLALVTIYPDPDPTLLEKSHHTLHAIACKLPGPNSLRVVSVKDIRSVVGMVPMPQHAWLDGESTVFVVEKLGLELAYMGGAEEPIDDDDD
ncbi:hypothetical protein BOTBODRAFT_178841 [Botryobasidium botryosum FD-172 SS1]|uniref:Transposase family Tnp2 protein n=1 Tax=Botryobasidium botryosum (strain FD-172 SS1) TaxID=930990 RepID=A0A067M1G9_BOTB1|nr:hypothetical protein BOTBODRAFT_178841 [Botryobasidium botryosum FD-172 SS1]